MRAKCMERKLTFGRYRAVSECDRLLTLYETLSSPALKAQPVQLVVVTSTGKETTAEQPPLRQVTSRDVVVPPRVVSETAELLWDVLGAGSELRAALPARQGEGRFPEQLAKEALSALRTWAPEALDLAEAWRRSLEAPLPKPVSLGYSSGLRGGMPKRAGDAAAPPVRGKRAKAGEPQQLGGGYAVGDVVYYDGADWPYDDNYYDDMDIDNVLCRGTKGKVTGPATVEDCVGKGVEVDFGIHSRFDFTFDLVRRRRRRAPPTLRSPPPCLPRPPRTPPRQHTNAA